MKPLDQYLIERHAGDLWSMVFDVLDCEIDTNTDSNGQIATKVEKAFYDAIREAYS